MLFLHSVFKITLSSFPYCHFSDVSEGSRDKHVYSLSFLIGKVSNFKGCGSKVVGMKLGGGHGELDVSPPLV